MATETKIRPATKDDVPAIIEMAQLFYATTSYADICPMDDTQAAGLAIILMDAGIMLVAEREGALVGMAGLIVEPFTFNPSITMATEIVWWVRPDARGSSVANRLLLAITDACRERECDMVRMMTLHDSPPQAAALYQRDGYAPTEHAFTKRLQ